MVLTTQPNSLRVPGRRFPSYPLRKRPDPEDPAIALGRIEVYRKKQIFDKYQSLNACW